MYPNLKAEMQRYCITGEMIASSIGVHPATMSSKLNIENRLKLGECIQIRNLFFSGMSLDYLFAYFVDRSVSNENHSS